MFLLGIFVGIALGTVVTIICHKQYEKGAVEYGCVELDGRIYEIIPWKKGSDK